MVDWNRHEKLTIITKTNDTIYDHDGQPTTLLARQAALSALKSVSCA